LTTHRFDTSSIVYPLLSKSSNKKGKASAAVSECEVENTLEREGKFSSTKKLFCSSIKSLGFVIFGVSTEAVLVRAVSGLA